MVVIKSMNNAGGNNESVYNIFYWLHDYSTFHVHPTRPYYQGREDNDSYFSSSYNAYNFAGYSGMDRPS